MPMWSDTNRDKACLFIKKHGLLHADMAMVSSSLGTHSHFWPGALLWDADASFCLRHDPEFCHHLRYCSYQNSFFPKHFFITFIHIPCSAWREVHNHLLPSALSPFWFHGWSSFYWWGAYPLYAKLRDGFLVVLEQTGFSEGATGNCLNQL